MTPEFLQRLCRIVEETLMLPPFMSIGAKTRIREDLGADEMDVSEIVVRVQNEWDVTLPEAPFVTVEDLGNLVSEQLATV